MSDRFKKYDQIICTDVGPIGTNPSNLTLNKVYICESDEYYADNGCIVIKIFNDNNKIFGYLKDRFLMHKKLPDFFQITKDCSSI